MIDGAAGAELTCGFSGAGQEVTIDSPVDREQKPDPMYERSYLLNLPTFFSVSLKR